MKNHPSDRPKVEALRRFGSRLSEGVAGDVSSSRLAGRSRWQMTTAVATVALAGVVAFTPPGGALAEEVQRLLGIGDPPTEPAQPGERAIVIGSGESARSVPYEIVVETNAAGRETCVSVEFPSAPFKVRGGNCLTGDRSIPLDEYAQRPHVYAAPPALGPEGELVVAATMPIGAVPEVRYELVSGEVETPDAAVADLTPALSEPIEVQDRFRYLFAVIPSGVLAGTTEDPTVLTDSSIQESLSRIHYKVTGEDGTVLVAGTLAEILSRSEGPVLPEAGSLPGVSLLLFPPDGFRTGTGGTAD